LTKNEIALLFGKKSADVEFEKIAKKSIEHLKKGYGHGEEESLIDYL